MTTRWNSSNTLRRWKEWSNARPDPGGQRRQSILFHLDRNFGGQHWDGMRATMSVVPGFKEVEGVGDRAMIGSFGTLSSS